MEATHLRQPGKLETLIALLAIAIPDAGQDSIMLEHIIANQKLSKQRLGIAFSSRVWYYGAIQ